MTLEDLIHREIQEHEAQERLIRRRLEELQAEANQLHEQARRSEQRRGEWLSKLEDLNPDGPAPRPSRNGHVAPEPTVTE